jgi:hypothetical protein
MNTHTQCHVLTHTVHSVVVYSEYTLYLQSNMPVHTPREFAGLIIIIFYCAHPSHVCRVYDPVLQPTYVSVIIMMVSAMKCGLFTQIQHVMQAV